MITFDGLVSGLNTNTIIEGLVSIQQAQVDRLNSQKADITNQQTAFKGIEAQLFTLRSALSSLGRSRGNVIDSKVVTSTNENLLTASADESAVNGNYSFRVDSVATAEQIASNSFDSTSTEIPTGTLEIQVGNGSSSTIEITSQNNTVEGLVNEINEQSDDVFASLVTDSSGVRILLTANSTGSANEIAITNNLNAPTGDQVLPDFSGPAVQDAADAQITVGSGAGAISLTSETNIFEDVIAGLTLNVSQADPAEVVTVTVGNDNEGIKESINRFVDAFNQLVDYIDSQTQFSPETEQAGPLLGNRNTISIQDRLRNQLVTTVPGISSALNQLGSLGIEFNDAGKLFVDDTQLSRVLNGEVEGVGTEEIKSLFALTGNSSQPGIEFLFGSSRTQSTDVPFLVDITQAAEQATVSENGALASSIVIDSSNDTFSLSVDGQSTGTLSLTHGTYTQEEIADHIQSVVNGSSGLNGQSVSTRIVGGVIELNSNNYGSNSALAEFSGSALATLNLTSDQEDEGQDVAGQFIVNGKIETATGTGRLLVGDIDNESTADIQLRITLDSSEIDAGSEGTLSVSRGFASELDRIIGDLVDPVTGQVSLANSSFNDQIDSIEQSIEQTQLLIESKTESLLAEFAALESTLSSLQNTNSFLVNQLGVASISSSSFG